MARRVLRGLFVVTLATLVIISFAGIGGAGGSPKSETARSKSLCKGDGWLRWGFANQGQCVRAEAQGMLWDLSTEFLVYPQHLNPNPDRYGNSDIWTFLGVEAESVAEPDTYELLGFYNNGLGWPQPSHEGWEYEQVPPQTPAWSYPWVHATGLGETSTMHPGRPRVEPEYAITAWTSPFEGTVRITGGVADGDEAGLPGSGCFKWQVDGVDWQIRTTSGTGSSLIASGAIPDGGSEMFPDDLSVDVATGSSIYFLVGPQGNFLCDATRISITVIGEGPRRAG